MSSSLATRTMQSVLIGSEYPVMDTLLFYFLKSSYRNLFRGVAECYAFSCFHDNVGLRDLPAIRHIKGTDAVIVNNDALVGNAVLLFSVVHLNKQLPAGKEASHMLQLLFDEESSDSCCERRKSILI